MSALPDTMNPTTSAEARASMDLERAYQLRAGEATKAWGLSGEVTKQRLTDETLWWLNQASSALAEAGRRVALAHDLLGPAEWKAWVAQDLKLSSRTAYNLLGVAKRLLGDGKGHEKILSLGPTKVYELLANFDDEQLDVLEQGGDVEDLNLDRFDDMSVREMKASLRKLKEHKDSYLKRAQEAERTTDELKTKLHEEQFGKAVEDERPRTLLERWRMAEMYLSSLHNFITQEQSLADASPHMFARVAAITSSLDQWARELRHEVDVATATRSRDFVTVLVEIDGSRVQLSENALSFCAAVWIGHPSILPGNEVLKSEVWRDGWTLEGRDAAAKELVALRGLLPIDDGGERFFWNVRDPADRTAAALERYHAEMRERTGPEAEASPAITPLDLDGDDELSPRDGAEVIDILATVVHDDDPNPEPAPGLPHLRLADPEE